MSNLEIKPKNRSKIRAICGIVYYTSKKYIHWSFSGKKYCENKDKNKYRYLVFEHKTPLYRKLKDVDMWMQDNKVINLKIAIELLDGIIIKPGECFSYWKLIGRPTYRRGFREGMVIKPNGQISGGIGGGLCQLSNLIYWMTLHTPLTVIERYRHSHDVFPDSNRTQPFGSGATCYYNFLDLEIKNETDTAYQLLLSITDEYLVGEWRSVNKCNYKYEIYEKEHSITPSFFNGYIRNNIIYRKVFNLDNELIRDEYISENHAYMVYNPYLN